MADEKLYGPRQVKNLYPRDPNWAKAVDALWRVYYGLYNEKYKKYVEKDELGELIDPWLKNKISKDISYGQGIGQDHLIAGNRSIAIGQGGKTTSFMELLLGAYPTIATDQNATEWIWTDRLVALGNGLADDDRSLVFEILKNGFFKFLNGIKVGKYEPRDEEFITPAGTIQWTPENSLEIWENEKWNPLFILKATDSEVINANEETNINHYLAPDHLHLLEAYCVGGRGDGGDTHVAALVGTDPAVAGVTIYADQEIDWDN